MQIIRRLAEELGLSEAQVEKTVALIDDGNTIPFIARYRKEVTGSLDDVTLRSLFDRLTYLRNLEARKAEVIASITEQDKMTDEIMEAIENAQILAEIEDIYRPFKPKRRTRASVARERGLSPLAEALMLMSDEYVPTLDEIANSLIDPEKGVETLSDAYAGARDIIAEDISDNAEYRKEIREMTYDFGVIKSKAAKDEDSVYSMYYDYSEGVKSIADHRILALNRGEKEEFLKVSVEMAEDAVISYLIYAAMTSQTSPASGHVRAAIIDSYDRLIKPSIENEIRSMLFDRAGEGAIKLFSDNLKHLLMQPPVKGKCVLGLDPGYRTGCKLAVVDKTGKVLDTAVIYPTKPQERIEESTKIVKGLVSKWKVELIAIGNGTASKESEIFIANVIKEVGGDLHYAMVSEAGASVYSASPLAADEFPDFDVTQRSAVSIARRLQDPLAELVKIDPKSIGVGQYQHDMKPARLDESLTGVVEDCVNSVGVDVNTASHSLLSYIAGINATSAKNIVKYREENGEFKSRKEIMKVPRIGAKAYEQCAGFLRVPSSKEILDNTGVHPESYEAALRLLEMFGYSISDVRENNLSDIRDKVTAKGIKATADVLGIGEPTLVDIISELEKPGRDVRDSLPSPVLRDDVMDMSDLKPGMKLTGTVRNVIDFGAFVDIGVHQDGLVHVSEISDKFIKHPSQVLSVGDIVTVMVKSVDLNKKRIALTMKSKI
ncbi:MAG: RNA-binding transcriptional accessory protein [Ruminococcaceae bacterium]|nr:RNA-binding transcriptional accessory protein [Oscillospiraceae bacterium]